MGMQKMMCPAETCDFSCGASLVGTSIHHLGFLLHSQSAMWSKGAQIGCVHFVSPGNVSGTKKTTDGLINAQSGTMQAQSGPIHTQSGPIHTQSGHMHAQSGPILQNLEGSIRDLD